MAESLSKAPSEYLGSVSAEAGEAFRALRNALLDSGPLDRVTCELIMISNLASAGYEDSFKIHAKRLLDADVPMAALKQAVVVPLGGSTVIFPVARALLWLEELER
ncbi:hypothetical protein ASG91_19040 [Phycicoccus sp. Soil802]|nr:hypothetical protein ASG91_19040 [Phycicoccus sp. Soil802]